MSALLLSRTACAPTCVLNAADYVDAVRGLPACEGITVIGPAATSVDALQLFGELRPEVTLVDIDLGGESSFELAAQLHRAVGSPPSPAILISTHAAQDFAELIIAPPC